MRRRAARPLAADTLTVIAAVCAQAARTMLSN